MAIKKYWFKQLNQEQRVEIYHLTKSWKSNRYIGKQLWVSHTTIWRELCRNSKDCWRDRTIYKPIYAEKKKNKRRNQALLYRIKLRHQHWLRMKILEILKDETKQRWPDEILWRLKIEWHSVVSTSTLYRYLHCYSDRSKYLLHGKKWYRNKKQKGKLTTTIKWVPKIDTRDEIVDTRSRIWDFEIDTIVSKWHSWWLFTAVDRKARYTFITKIPNHKAKTLLTIMTYTLKWQEIQTITSDNWVEFSQLKELWKRLKVKVYTAYPYRSRERGTNERHNWLIRRFIPKWCNISKYSDEYIQKIADILNHKPRKILGYRTPYEVYHNL